MALYLYYKEGKLTKWRRIPIGFANREQAEEYYNKYFKGSKYKILYEEEEKIIAEKKAKRKKTLEKIGRTTKRGAVHVGKQIAKGAKATHERLKVAGPRDYDRMQRELGEPTLTKKTTTAYDRRLRELKEERRKKEREISAKELERLAEKRAEEKYRSKTKRTQTTVKKKEWRPPPSPFGEFELNLDRSPFESAKKQTKQYAKGGPGFKSPFAPVHFNPAVNPFGIEFGQKKKKKKQEEIKW